MSELSEVIKACFSMTDFCKKLNISTGGGGFKKAKKLIEENKLDISHFDEGLSKKRKWPTIKKVCPVCGKIFEAKIWEKKQKATCSYSCSNTFFRSGKNNPNWKELSTQYRTKCFQFHKKECVICGENKVVEVHHIDENRENNIKENLVPLCPTHHKYWHSEYRSEVEDKINKYIKEFKENVLYDTKDVV